MADIITVTMQENILELRFMTVQTGRSREARKMDGKRFKPRHMIIKFQHARNKVPKSFRENNNKQQQQKMSNSTF